jgi:hypothetical protein
MHILYTKKFRHGRMTINVYGRGNRYSGIIEDNLTRKKDEKIKVV